MKLNVAAPIGKFVVFLYRSRIFYISPAPFMMFWDFNLFLLAGMSSDALGGWICFWFFFAVGSIFRFLFGS